MAVAQVSKADAIASAAAKDKSVLPTYYEVTLNSVKSFYDFVYKPGVVHIVDGDTLKLLGDAVAEKKQIKA